MRKITIAIALIIFGCNAFAQQIERFNPDTIKTIMLDSNVNIVAQKLSVETFIKAVTTDTTFYAAFRRMKQHGFIAENRIFTYDKKNKVNGKIYRKIRHSVNPVKIDYLVKQDTGKVFKKNGKYQLYTIEMFDYIFMNAYKTDFVADAPSGTAKGESNASYKDKLKTLIFNPGRPVKGIPFIGSKTEIFTANMRQYYDYGFQSGTYLDSIPVYRFRVSVKDGLSSWTKDGLMIKELVTIFDKRNFAILGRYVDMKYSNLLFDFDVQMNIEMSYFNEVKMPTKITYQGNWNIPFKKEERASFLILHKDYQ